MRGSCVLKSYNFLKEKESKKMVWFAFIFEAPRCVRVVSSMLFLTLPTLKPHVSCPCGSFFYGGRGCAQCSWYNPQSIQIQNEFHWIKCNSVDRQTRPNRIPTDPQANISFHFRFAVGTKEGFRPKCLGSCSVQRMIFFPPLLPIAIFLTLLKGLFS